MVDENEMEGAARSATYQLAPGTLLQNGRYVVESALGKGGMGHVYLARDTHFTGVQALRALKEMIPRYDDLQANLIQFAREANTLVTLRHPGIPTVYDSFTEFRRAYLVLDYIPGSDLEALLKRSPDMLLVEDVGRWMCQLCEIVSFLHTKHPPIIFRDVKPSNVVLTPEKRIVLIDFGIAKVFETEEFQTNVGTPGYAPREQYEGRAEPRSDIYSLGAMMHHLLSKCDPRFQAPFTFHERPLRQYNPAVSPELEAVVMRCLQDDISRRYQSAEELRVALVHALGFSARPVLEYRSAGVAGVARPAASGEPELLWRHRTGDEVRAQPVVHGGLLYIGSYDRRLYALDKRTGDLRWQFEAQDGLCGTPALWRDYAIFGSEDAHVYAVERATGHEVWRYRTGNCVRSSPCVFEDRVYVGSDDGHLHVLDPRNGQVLWRYRAYGEVQSSPRCADGAVYFGASDHYIYALDIRTQERRWTYRTQGPILSSPTLAEGYLYVGSSDFSVYCLEARGGWVTWSERTDRIVVSSPCVVGDRVYVGSSDHYLYCLHRRTGQRLWRYDAGSQINSSPASADGAVYFGCIDGGLYCLDGASGKPRWRFQTGDMVPGSPYVRDDVVYVGSTDGWVYAIKING